jgi:hypothetical protein
VGKKKSGIREATRDDLITMVQRGEMTPENAESEAKRVGLGLLASEPDPNDYDPMREPFWTLSMAWIAYRTQDAVRNWWDEYRKEFSVWRYQEWRVGPDGPVHQGHSLEGRPNATLVRRRATINSLIARETSDSNKDDANDRCEENALGDADATISKWHRE